MVRWTADTQSDHGVTEQMRSMGPSFVEQTVNFFLIEAN